MLASYIFKPPPSVCHLKLEDRLAWASLTGIFGLANSVLTTCDTLQMALLWERRRHLPHLGVHHPQPLPAGQGGGGRRGGEEGGEQSGRLQVSIYQCSGYHAESQLSSCTIPTSVSMCLFSKNIHHSSQIPHIRKDIGCICGHPAVVVLLRHQHISIVSPIGRP